MLRELTEDTYKVALSMLKGATYELLSILRQRDITLKEFFTLSDTKLRDALGVNNPEFFDASLRDLALTAAGKEEQFMERHHIRALFIEDEDYPARLAAASMPPLILYQLGECDLNANESLGIVGTRRITSYGADCEKKIITDLAKGFPDICIVSGLAFGTDAIAHATAIENGCPTVGVVAHGLDTIYPAANRDLARRMIKNGGAIITEYPSGTSAYRGRFLERNRIIAWMTDGSLIIESPVRGGAMSTANHAFSENREVFALPGRISDEMSEGCNLLIRCNKASLVTSAADIIDMLGWKSSQEISLSEVKAIFPELEGYNRIIFETLRSANEPITPDALRSLTGLQIGIILSTLTELEFEGIVIRQPGNRYSAI